MYYYFFQIIKMSFFYASLLSKIPIFFLGKREKRELYTNNFIIHSFHTTQKGKTKSQNGKKGK